MAEITRPRDNPLPKFFHLLGEAQNASDAVDMSEKVDPALERAQSEACRALVAYCVKRELALMAALLPREGGSDA